MDDVECRWSDEVKKGRTRKKNWRKSFPFFIIYVGELFIFFLSPFFAPSAPIHFTFNFPLGCHRYGYYWPNVGRSRKERPTASLYVDISFYFIVIPGACTPVSFFNALIQVCMLVLLRHSSRFFFCSAIFR